MSRAESQGGLTIREKINLFGMARGPSPDQGSSRSSVGSLNSKGGKRVSSVAKRHLAQGQSQSNDKRSNSTLNRPKDGMMALIKKKNAIELESESASRATARYMKRQSEMVQTSKMINQHDMFSGILGPLPDMTKDMGMLPQLDQRSQRASHIMGSLSHDQSEYEIVFQNINTLETSAIGQGGGSESDSLQTSRHKHPSLGSSNIKPQTAITRKMSATLVLDNQSEGNPELTFDFSAQAYKRGHSFMMSNQPLQARPSAPGSTKLPRRLSRYNATPAAAGVNGSMAGGSDAIAPNWRATLLSKLTYEKIWLTPETKPKTHQTVIIFDWDDTLLPTSFLIPY